MVPGSTGMIEKRASALSSSLSPKPGELLYLSVRVR
jgi:hypothetical protein